MTRTREERVFEAVDSIVVTFYCGVAALALAPVIALCVLYVVACWAEDWIERGKTWLRKSG